MQSGVVGDNGKLSGHSLVQKGLAISLVWYESVSFVYEVSPSVSCSLRSYRISSGTTPYLCTSKNIWVAPDVIRGCRRQRETVRSFVESEGSGDFSGVV